MRRHRFVASVIAASLTLFLLSGCQNPDSEGTKDINAFSFTAVGNPALTADAVGTVSGSTILVVLPLGTDKSSPPAFRAFG